MYLFILNIKFFILNLKKKKFIELSKRKAPKILLVFRIIRRFKEGNSTYKNTQITPQYCNIF